MINKTKTYLKAFANGRGWTQTQRALNAANILHEGQTRKSGEPYVGHPVMVAAALLALQIYDDVVIAAALLHDVVEDCNISAAELKDRFGISSEVLCIVKKLTKIAGMPTDLYYKEIETDWRAMIIKLADRCHNISTMAGAFSNEKMEKYVDETVTNVFPMCNVLKRFYPEYSDQVFSMKYQLISNCKIVCHFLQKEFNLE